MRNEEVFNAEYDYSVALIFSQGVETLIGGTEKILKRTFKDIKNPNLDIKGLDIYYREKTLGTFAADVNQNAARAEMIIEQSDRLYTNLLNPNSNAMRVSETKLYLEKLFRIDSTFTVRLLARTILNWYEAVTDIYMNGRKNGIMRIGLPLPQKDRAALGEQFKADADALVENMFTALKRKKLPSETWSFGNILERSAAEIAEFLAEYKRYMSENKAFCIYCKDCERYFISASWNAHYCPDCKALRKKTSKQVFLEKNSVGFRQTRQRLQYSFENFMSKSAIWKRFTPAERKKYKKLHEEFLAESKKMLQEFDEGKIDEPALNEYFGRVKTSKLKLEQDGNHKK